MITLRRLEDWLDWLENHKPSATSCCFGETANESESLRKSKQVNARTANHTNRSGSGTLIEEWRENRGYDSQVGKHHNQAISVYPQSSRIGATYLDLGKFALA